MFCRGGIGIGNEWFEQILSPAEDAKRFVTPALERHHESALLVEGACESFAIYRTGRMSCNEIVPECNSLLELLEGLRRRAGQAGDLCDMSSS